MRAWVLVRRLVARRDEHGLALVWTVVVLGVLIGVAAFAIDLVHAYWEGERAQKAADAGALAGAAQIPGDKSCQEAQTYLVAANRPVGRAQDVAEKNALAPPSTPGGPGSSITANCAPGTAFHQVDVEVTTKIDTFFGRFLGFRDLTVKRRSSAAYDGPIVMGSPGNNLGDVPECPPGAATNCVAPAANKTQRLWAQIQGPAGEKQAGNAYTSGYCSNAKTDGCKSQGFGTGSQTEYNSEGEYFFIHSDGSQDLEVWLYDASMVATGPMCQDSNYNLPVTGYPSAVSSKYSDPKYCAGDQDLAGPGQSRPGSLPMKTTYEFRQPDATPQPDDNPTYSASGCDPTTYGGHDATYDDTTGKFTLPDWGSLDSLTKSSFHQWRKFCTLPAGTPGDWVLHVSSPDEDGRGSNSFSILTLDSSGSPAGQVFTRTRLPIYATNPASGATSEFYVARVLPTGKDRLLKLSFFDLGDQADPTASATGTISFTWAGASPAPALRDCRWEKPPSAGAPGRVGSLPYSRSSLATQPDCEFTYDKTGASTGGAAWNGRWVTVEVTIPESYSCDPSDAQNCWLKMKYTPTSGKLGDATTWNATMDGAPVRLTK